MSRRFNTLLACVALAAFAAAPAKAETFQFSVNYLGSNTGALAAGSANPTDTLLALGDSFDYEMLAQPGMAWRVDTSASVFAMFALATNETANRIGDVVLTLSLGGSTVFSYSEQDISQSYVHIGTNDVDLTAGMSFDRAVFSYTLHSASEYVYDPDTDEYVPTGLPAETSLQGMSPIFGYPDFHQSNSISYVTAVPEPGVAALLAAGLLAIGFRLRQRQLQPVLRSASSS